jgi:hypothetical protein
MWEPGNGIPHRVGESGVEVMRKTARGIDQIRLAAYGDL